MRTSQANGPVKDMKCKFFVGCLVLGMAWTRVNAASDFYVNDSVVLCPPQLPPQVDATNFVNNNYFSINFTNFVLTPQFYQTASTRNFTNNGMMIANSGFRFDTAPSGSGAHSMAANFVNTGTISSGSAANTNTFANLFLLTAALPKTLISATNVSLRSSTNIVGVDGVFSLTSKNLDLNRAFIAMEGYEDNPDSLFNIFGSFGLPGMSAAYWGADTNVMVPANNFEFSPPRTPFSLVQQPGGFLGFQQLVLPGAKFYVDEFIVGTNRFVQAVFLNNTNVSILNNVYFPAFGLVVVEWLGLATNQVSGAVTTNLMYLTDDFGSFGTNTVITNFSYYSASGTAMPINYSFSRINPFPGFLGGAFPATSPVGEFDPVVVTNQFAAFGAVFAPTTVSLSSLPPAGQFLTNLPGRIEITADHTLDLSFARIAGLNYLSLKATNNISAMGGAKISVPFSDINLATTNGSLAITNLLFPTVQRFTGTVDLWSGRWTNDFGGLNTRYSVLFVDSRLSSTAPSQVQDLTLRSTNIVISDILNVTRNLMIDAQRVTVASNVPPAVVPTGQLNLLSSAITWPGSTPRLQYLTNNGSISALNSVFFGGSRFSPFFTSNYNEPYLAFVNRGTVTTEGSLIWANYFENSGQFGTGIGFGSISLQSLDARLTNGGFVAIKGDISISSGSLSISNHVLQAGRTLTLSITNNLTDTGFSNANSWVVGRGFNLPVKPVTGDLLGTTITETAQPGIENTHLWAGQDRGADGAGYSNNVALGFVRLDGLSSDSLFSFTGAGSNNALYVDYLDLRNYATNIDQQGNLTEVSVAGNMRIYYGQAVAGGISVAERLNHANGDRLRWVSDYSGINSGTNVVYPDGTTNRLNTALVLSQNEDSDGDGLPNSADPSPLLLVTTASLPVATNGTAYSTLLQNGGGVAPFTWTLVSGVLPQGLALSSSGVISGTPTETGLFTIRVRVSQATYGLFAERELIVNVQPGLLLLSVAIEHHSPPGARVGWRTTVNSTNYVYYRNSLATGNWLLLTNFVSAAAGDVSIWDPVGTNQSRYYRVQVKAPQP
jgi:hypothetical protein